MPNNTVKSHVGAKCYYPITLPSVLTNCSLTRRSDVSKIPNIREWLIEQAGDLKGGISREIFERFLRHLCFQHDAGQRGKLRAIITGSCPSAKAKSVAAYRDIDIWIFWNHHYHHDYEWIDLLYLLDPEIRYDYTSKIPGLLKVANVGKIQFLVIHYETKSNSGEFEENCLCDYHLQKCFPDSHNVTRYRFIVFEDYEPPGTNKKTDLTIPCYIPYDEGSGILAKKTALDGFPEDDKSYPAKHRQNDPSLSPPTLFYQALLSVIREYGRKKLGHVKNSAM